MKNGFIAESALVLVALALLAGGYAMYENKQIQQEVQDAGLIVGAPSARHERELNPIVDSSYWLGTTSPSTLAWWGIVTDEVCLAGDCRTTWPAGSGGGGGAGTWSTTTSQVTGQFINYPNETDDIVVIGSNATTSAEFYYDPNTLSFFARSASSTIAGPLNVVSTFRLPTISSGFAGIGGNNEIYSFASSSINLSDLNDDLTYENPLTFNWPLTRSTDTISWSGLATTSQPTAGQLLYSNGLTGLTPVSTSSVTISSPLTSVGTAGYVIGGSGWTLDLATTTNSLFSGIGGQILSYIDGSGWFPTATTTYGDGLTWTAGDVDCDTADTNTFGCLSDTDWDTFNNKQNALGFTPANQSTTLTIAGTANQITSSAGAQDLSTNRTWTLSLPSHVVFPANFQATNATTVNATTTALDISSLLTFDSVTSDEWSDFCVSITGDAGLCDGDDAEGAGGSGNTTWEVFGTNFLAPTTTKSVQVGATTSPITINSLFSVNATNTTSNLITASGTPSFTGNFFQALNSAGAELFSVDSDGGVTTPVLNFSSGLVLDSATNQLIVTGDNLGTLDFDSITTDRVYTFPDEDGVLCIDTNFCDLLSTANTWTALQTFNYSSSTVYSSFLTSSSTFATIGTLQGVLDIDATTETTLESEIDSLTGLTAVGTVTTGTWDATTVAVTAGGTGAETLTDHGVLVGSGTGAITALAVGTNGQLLIGSTGADPVFATLNCADNLTCTTGAGTLEIDLDTTLTDLTHITSSYASTTYFSTQTASSTFAHFGTLNLPKLSDGCLNIASGVVGSTGSACGGGSADGYGFVLNSYGGTNNVQSTTSPLWLKATTPRSLIATSTFATFASTTQLSIGAYGATPQIYFTDDGDGALTIQGIGNSQNESLTFNFDDTANTVDVTSGTGVTVFDFNTINIQTDELEGTGDTDTDIVFASDAITITAGGVAAITITEAGTDTITFGNYLPSFTNAPRPTANDGAALGVSGTAWSDLFLADGGIINWNAGNTTLTHSAGNLTLNSTAKLNTSYASSTVYATFQTASTTDGIFGTLSIPNLTSTFPYLNSSGTITSTTSPVFYEKSFTNWASTTPNSNSSIYASGATSTLRLYLPRAISFTAIGGSIRTGTSLLCEIGNGTASSSRVLTTTATETSDSSTLSGNVTVACGSGSGDPDDASFTVYGTYSR